jgi:hypothetical protein
VFIDGHVSEVGGSALLDPPYGNIFALLRPDQTKWIRRLSSTIIRYKKSFFEGFALAN